MINFGIYRVLFGLLIWNLAGYLTISDFGLLTQFYYASAGFCTLLISYSYYNLEKENIVYGRRIKNIEVNQTIKTPSSPLFNDNLNEYLR